jgi:hypothetical protein
MEDTMTRRPFTSTPHAAALQIASLLVVAAGVLGILVSDIMRNRAGMARVEAPSNVQHHASSPEGDAN